MGEKRTSSKAVGGQTGWMYIKMQINPYYNPEQSSDPNGSKTST